MLLPVDINDKRFRIMKAAAKIFAMKGFHRSKIEEVAREADVGKGTVYEYFSSKEQLFIDLFNVGREFYIETLLSQLENETELDQQLEKAAYLHLAFIHEHKDVARVLMQEFLQLGDEMQEALVQAHEQEIGVLEGIFKQGIQDGYFRTIDARLTAQVFYGSVHALGAPMIFHGEKKDLGKLPGEIVDIFLQGIKK